MSVKDYWTAAKTKRRQEQRASKNIDAQGFQYYLPEISSFTSRGTNKRELLFPGYVFVKICLGWESLLSTRGITRLFLRDGKPVRIPEREIDYFKKLEDEEGFVQLDPPLRSGTVIYANTYAGVFHGVRGIVSGMVSASRVRVLLEMLGREVEIEIDRRIISIA